MIEETSQPRQAQIALRAVLLPLDMGRRIHQVLQSIVYSAISGDSPKIRATENGTRTYRMPLPWVRHTEQPMPKVTYA